MQTNRDSEKPLIFLSYRRGDIPGYVGRLSDELELVYGQERVFRDVDDIRGGTRWKQVIEEAISLSAVMILMIGPRWCEIWRKRTGEDVNYVAMELQVAKAHGLTIIPVTLGGAVLDADLELGEVEWLRQLQWHDISDRQQRWDHDVNALVELIAQVPDMWLPEIEDPRQQKPSPEKRKSKKVIWGVLAALLLLIGLGLIYSTPQRDEPKPIPEKEVITRSEDPKNSTKEVNQPKQVETSPLISRLQGVWVSQKSGLEFRFKPIGQNQFKVEVPGKGKGSGRALLKMPNKIAFKIKGLGEAEFSLSNSESRMTGWYRLPGSSTQNFDTLNQKNRAQ